MTENESKKSLLEPEISVKTEPSKPIEELSDAAAAPPDHFDKFLKKAKKVDPLLLWGVLRPKILNHVSLWDFLIDKTLLKAQSLPSLSGNDPSERLQILLAEINDLMTLTAQALAHCCESPVKIENGHQEEGEESSEVFVPQQLLPALGINKTPVKLKQNIDYSQYERLFNVDESLKPDEDDDDLEDVKDEGLKNLDDLDFLDFALEQVEDQEEPEDPAWKPTPKVEVMKKPMEKPRQCDKCKKVFPRRQNYHFHRTKGRCPGAPQPPKFHKLHESKYYCVHPDCGSANGDINESTPCFTSRGIYWKHLAEKHITDQDKVRFMDFLHDPVYFQIVFFQVFQCEVCPEKFAYQEMLKFHLQQKHEKQV